MARLVLHLLGSFQATLDGQPLQRFRSNKVRALLAYLTLKPERDHPRERLATLLWGEYPTQSALLSLRVSLSNLRQLLAPLLVGERDPPLLSSTRENIRFTPRPADCWVDVAEFDTLLAACYSHTHPEMARCRACAQRLARATGLYRGDLLADLPLTNSPAFDEWLLLEQEIRRQRMMAALDTLASHHAALGHYAQAIHYGQCLVELEPWAEASHRQLMRLLALSGQTSAALAQYETCHRLLADDLGMEPAPETTALYERIRAGSFVGEGTRQAASPIPDPDASGAAHTLFPTHAPFVGRVAELARLDGFLAESMAGQGRVVFVTGGAGSGKTVLLGEFVRRATAAHDEVVAAWGRCESSAGIGDPYLPFRDILLSLAGGNDGEEPGDTTISYRSRSWRALPALVEALVDHGPELIDLMVPRAVLLQGLARGPAPTGRESGRSALDRLRDLLEHPVANSVSRNPSQTNLFEQITHVLQILARQMALILVLDDLHWADAASASLLFHLGRRLAGSRILIAGAYRPVNVALGHPATGSQGERHPLEPVVYELQRRYGEVEVPLKPEGRCFVDALLDTEPNRLGESFRAALAEHTGGQPLFTIELLRSLQEQKGIVRDAAGRWVEGLHLDWDCLPARVTAVIAERVGRLPTDLQALLAAASVQGHEFIAEIVALVLGLDDGEIVQLLSGPLCRQHRLVLPKGTSRVGEQTLSQYRFRHHLFQRYLYLSLDAIERARHHRATGSALETLLGDQPGALEARAPSLARHYRLAGQATQAIGYLQQAARRSVEMSANQEALVHLEQALELLNTLPETPERDSQEVVLRLALYAPLIATESYGSPRLGHSCVRTQFLCQQMGDTPQLISVNMTLAGHYSLRAEFQTALAHAEKALVLARRQGEAGCIVWAQQVIGMTQMLLGNLAAARNHMAATWDTDDGQHPAMLVVRGSGPRVVGYAWNAWILWLLGYPDQAQQCTQSGLRMARTLDHTHSLAVALLIGGIHLAQMRRELDDLQGWLEELEALVTAHHITHMQALVHFYQGWLSARSDPGQARASVERMQRALDAWLTTGMKALEPLYLSVLADACLDSGQWQEAQHAMDTALAIAEETQEEVVAAELHRLQGELLLADSKDAEAEACFERAIQVAHQQQARSLELRATMRLARLLHGRGRSEKARRLLAEIYGWFTEGFDTPDLREAKALLDELKTGRDS